MCSCSLLGPKHIDGLSSGPGVNSSLPIWALRMSCSAPFTNLAPGSCWLGIHIPAPSGLPYPQGSKLVHYRVLRVSIFEIVVMVLGRYLVLGYLDLRLLVSSLNVINRGVKALDGGTLGNHWVVYLDLEAMIWQPVSRGPRYILSTQLPGGLGARSKHASIGRQQHRKL